MLFLPPLIAVDYDRGTFQSGNVGLASLYPHPGSPSTDSSCGNRFADTGCGGYWGWRHLLNCGVPHFFSCSACPCTPWAHIVLMPTGVIVVLTSIHVHPGWHFQQWCLCVSLMVVFPRNHSLCGDHTHG